MSNLLSRIHTRVGDLWWYSAMIFIACRSGDVIQAFIGLWLVPKYVGPQELGAVLPLQQLAGLFAVPLAVIATVFAKYVNVYATRGEYGKVKSFIHDVLLTSSVIFLICIVGAFLFAPFFYERLRIQSGLLTLLILAAGFSTNIAALFTSALQGLKKFKSLTAVNIISAPIRLVTLLIGMPIRALSGYVLGQATPPASTALVAAFSLRKDFKSITIDTSWRKDIKSILKYFWPIAIYMMGGTLLGTIHATIYRQRLPEIESAAYYLLSRFAELSSFFGAALCTVLFPFVAEAHEKGKATATLLTKTLLGTFIPTIILCIMAWFFNNEIINISKTWSIYSSFSYLLPYMILTTGLGAMISLCITNEFACRRFKTTLILLILNVFMTIILVSSCGYSAFIGHVPDSFINIMSKCSPARLDILTYWFLSWNAIQLSFLLLNLKSNQK